MGDASINPKKHKENYVVYEHHCLSHSTRETHKMSERFFHRVLRLGFINICSIEPKGLREASMSKLKNRRSFRHNEKLIKKISVRSVQSRPQKCTVPESDLKKIEKLAQQENEKRKRSHSINKVAISGLASLPCSFHALRTLAGTNCC